MKVLNLCLDIWEISPFVTTFLYSFQDPLTLKIEVFPLYLTDLNLLSLYQAYYSVYFLVYCIDFPNFCPFIYACLILLLLISILFLIFSPIYLIIIDLLSLNQA